MGKINVLICPYFFINEPIWVLTAKYYYICCPYTDGYFRRLLYDISQILIASEVFTK